MPARLLLSGRAGRDGFHTHCHRHEAYGLDELAEEVAGLFDIEPEQMYSNSKYPKVVQARSLLCYWAVRLLGLQHPWAKNFISPNQLSASL
ncbi:hypothetical protein C4565_09650 [Candidatus Parcubacteria bacterium]|nr:MAG: hypothetical protein C4565_09650 [Candidatus Parcubacteria bacterium]